MESSATIRGYPQLRQFYFAGKPLHGEIAFKVELVSFKTTSRKVRQMISIDFCDFAAMDIHSLKALAANKDLAFGAFEDGELKKIDLFFAEDMSYGWYIYKVAGEVVGIVEHPKVEQSILNDETYRKAVLEPIEMGLGLPLSTLSPKTKRSFCVLS